MLDIWRGIRRRFVLRNASTPEDTLGSLSTAGMSEDVISYCLQMLKPYSAGTVLYILDCLCPNEVAVLDLSRLDLSQPHQHMRLAGKNARLRHDSYEELLAQLRAYTSIVPSDDYPDFWLELTRNWLVTCPIDPEYYREDESGKELYCLRLRSELIDRILRID